MNISRPRSSKALDELTDEDLVVSVLEGGSDGFALLMRRYNQRLYRVVRGITGDDANAEDALQQTYLSAYRNLGQFRGKARFGSWLRRIAVREALRDRRAAARRGEIHEEAQRSGVIPFPSSPEKRLSAREWARLLGATIDELPERYRIVLVMRKVEHMSTEETAEMLSMSSENVRIRLHRARKMLADRLYDEIGEAVDEVYEFGGIRCDRIVSGVLIALGL
ncbi:MAG: RNA polymerase sigma factor [Polyangiales bacterium]